MLTFEQKHKVVAHFANPENWHDEFKMEPLFEEKRKWNDVIKNGAMVTSDPEENHIVITHGKSGAFVELERKGNQVIIKDESERTLICEAGMTRAKDLKKGVLIPLFDERQKPLEAAECKIEIPSMNLYVHFSKSGQKTFIFDQTGHTEHLPEPSMAHQEKIRSLRFMHVINFTGQMAAAWGMKQSDLIDMAKLIVAREYGIEPSLSTFEQAITERVYNAITRLFKNKTDWQINERMRVLRYNVSNYLAKHGMFGNRGFTMDKYYSGNVADTPSNFFVAKTDDGFAMRTSLDQREIIRALSTVFKDSLSASVPEIQTVSTRTSMATFLHLLKQGIGVRDHRGREWSSIFVHSEEAPAIARNIRSVAREQFGLAGYNFTAMNARQNICLVTMDCDTLERVSKGYKATMAMIDLIRSGSDDTEYMWDLFDKGADLRYVDQLAAQGARTFATLMVETGNDALFQAVQEKRGVHDLVFARNTIM